MKQVLQRLGQWLRGVRSPQHEIPEHLQAGIWGEQQAESFLKAAGLKSLGQRLRAGKRGEIDLLMRDGEILVFVEVKTRRAESFGRPISAVGHQKRMQLSRAAVAYIKTLRAPPRYFRFDVVEVVGSPGDPAPTIRHIPNAFTLEGGLRPPLSGKGIAGR